MVWLLKLLAVGWATCMAREHGQSFFATSPAHATCPRPPDVPNLTRVKDASNLLQHDLQSRKKKKAKKQTDTKNSPNAEASEVSMETTPVALEAPDVLSAPEAPGDKGSNSAFETMHKVLDFAAAGVAQSEATVTEMRKAAGTLRNMFTSLNSASGRLTRISQMTFADLDWISRTMLLMAEGKSERMLGKIEHLLSNFSQEASDIAKQMDATVRIVEEEFRSLGSEAAAATMHDGSTLISSAILNMSSKLLEGKQALDGSTPDENDTTVTETVTTKVSNDTDTVTETVTTEDKLAEIKDQQQKAIEAEDFDEAKRLKEEISKLQDGLITPHAPNSSSSGEHQKVKEMADTMFNLSIPFPFPSLWPTSETLGRNNQTNLRDRIATTQTLLLEAFERLNFLHRDCQSLSDKLASAFDKMLPVLPNALGGKLDLSAIGDDIGEPAKACGNLHASVESLVMGLQSYLKVAEGYVSNEPKASKVPLVTLWGCGVFSALAFLSLFLRFASTGD